jgi:hypothetical protein
MRKTSNQFPFISSSFAIFIDLKTLKKAPEPLERIR